MLSPAKSSWGNRDSSCRGRQQLDRLPTSRLEGGKAKESWALKMRGNNAFQSRVKLFKCERKSFGGH